MQKILQDVTALYKLHDEWFTAEPKEKQVLKFILALINLIFFVKNRIGQAQAVHRRDCGTS